MSPKLNSESPAAVEVKVSCRVCGELVTKEAKTCWRCKTPMRRRSEEIYETTGTDVILVTFLAILALAISVPATLILSALLWRGGQAPDVMSVALTIAAINGCLIGCPISLTLWRWHDSAIDGHSQHRPLLREYWQFQALCLLPVGTISLFVGALWFCVTYLSG